MLKMTSIPTFRTGDGRTVQFFPVEDKIMRLTSTHRVVLDGKAVDWLSADYRPNHNTAAFFIEKHGARA